MTEIVKETISTQEVTPGAGSEETVNQVMTTPVLVEATTPQKFEYYIYFFLGVLEVLLAFRLVLKLMGASMTSTFVGFIYGLAGFFTLPFEGIFRRGFTQGIETTSVLEPATIVAMIVYALLAWGLVKLVRLQSGERQDA